MELGSLGYGTNGFTKKAMDELTARYWSTDEIAHFLGLPLNLVIEAGKEYVDFVGFGCAKAETLVFFIDRMEELGENQFAIKELLLTRYSSKDINKFFTQTLLATRDPKEAAYYLAGEFGKVLKSDLQPI